LKDNTLYRNFFNYVGQTSAAPLAIQIENAKGVFLYAKDKNYIDCISGIGVSNIGHGNPQVIEAIKHQAELHLHLMVYGEMIQAPQVNLAQKLASNLPSTLNNVYYVNSGSEAIEGAMKLAKRYTGKSNFVAQKLAYHGGTHGALSLMSDSYFSQKFVPLLTGISFINQNKIEEINEIINDRTAAVFIEPIMGEIGYEPCTLDYLTAIRKRCTEVGALLIFDEIQSGFGRSGSLFSFMQFNITPDVLVLAKSLGGGMPLGCFIASKDIMGVLMDNPVLGHINTFGGHPISCAAALAALTFILDHNLAEKAIEKEQFFRERLKHPKIINISGKGLMLALHFEDKIFCRKVIDTCIENGLLIDWFLYAEDRIRLAPPLIIEQEQITQVCNIILESIDQNI